MTALARELQRLGSGGRLTTGEARSAVAQIIENTATEVAIAAFLTALRVRGETADELTGAVQAIRDRMTVFETGMTGLLDTCGTGGDGANTINISTATAMVCAACGVKVAKHGNRSASGNCGSAEVLETLGVAIEPGTDVLERGLRELGIAFLFAPRFHPALRHAAKVRKQLPFRTLFNLVGPLVNPANPSYQLIGIPDARLADLMAAVVVRLGNTACAAVVTGAGGLDEVSLSGPNRVLWIEQGRISELTWIPADFGLPTIDVADLRVTGPTDSADKLRRMLGGEPGAIRDVVLANTAAALLVAGAAPDLRAGVARASQVVDTGAAARLLGEWGRFSHSSSGCDNRSP